MNLFIYDMIFILREGQKIPDVIDDVLDKVNPEAEIEITRRPSFAEVYGAKEGSFFTTGLIPTNPDGEKVARFGVAWFTDNKGRKHARVTADVKSVKLYEAFVLWPRHLPPNALVYPGSVYTSDKKYVVKCKCGRSGTMESLEWDGQCGICRQKQQYEKETGFQAAR